ncbi:tRNA (adenosine(37)-N6)-threonylcarbamoyltransferase complex dimerization subunit type 1 TsaB [Frankia sp. CcI156]|uniref:Peptidase M22, glycoprotease n=2 Tax=Frankia TaxID=1854 RepID=Q2JFD1_FRACC|nr:peptidase M22, glycoprotease [Frankia casuarinae]ETA04279.1 putative molecular chaperone, inactive metal-dependent protease like protein [Frankia sp. CcI6]KDA45048.1 putative molecular chaperone, inactive metal-dependent protease like protein [Frankia sp. BMG5.23]KFB06673.1 tRNA threonylcarbamoyl adenosine modification protein YeaZ [Frankia sp. Allo2]OFB41682.1 tRNA N6-adenosine(37)-N6-threonylcarbamoyltransferase complex dimerization subunit TsaB [Frankia sp. CgIM4]ONH30158.1 tRNA (adenosi
MALDTSTAACSVALAELTSSDPARPVSGTGGERAAPGVHVWPRAVMVTVDARRHGELLAPSMRAVLAEGGARPTDLDAVVVGAGPGPFTSLRVGMVTAAAFADALGVPVHGVCSLDAIGAATGGSVAVVTDARRREVFWACYRDGVRVGDPAVGRPADVVRFLRGLGVDRVVGPGTVLYPEIFAELAGTTAGATAGEVPAPGAGQPDDGYPRPELLVGLAGADVLAGRAPQPLVPLYLRRPDAAEPHTPKPVTV